METQTPTIRPDESFDNKVIALATSGGQVLEACRDRADWLKRRKSGIGGSEAASLYHLGFNPPLAIYLDKTMEAPDKEPTQAMKMGNVLEPVIRDLYIEATGREVWYQPLNRTFHPDHPRYFASLDGLTLDKDGNLVVFEAKTTSVYNSADWGPEGTDEVPLKYNIQCQWAMGITGAVRADIALLMGSEFRIYYIQRNDEIISRLRERADEFWKNHIEAKVPPSVEGESSDAAKDALLALYPAPAKATSNVIEDGGVEALLLIEAFEKAKADEKDAKKRKDEYSMKLKERIGGNLGVKALRLDDDGTPFWLCYTWTPSSRSAFSQSAFKEADPDGFASYIESSDSRTLRVKKLDPPTEEELTPKTTPSKE